MKNSNKNVNKVLCYVGLVFLVILLIIPPLFRLIFKEKQEEVKKDVITTMKCSKENEEVASTFLNDEPQVIQYSIIGDFSPKEDTSIETLTPSEILTRFIEFGEITYNEEKNVSFLKFEASVARGSADYELILRNQPAQEEYFRSQGFSCIKQTIGQ